MSSDADLYLRWLTARDEAAFRSLALAHADLVFDVARRVGGDRVRAEDAVQEALLALARDGTERPAEVGVRAWLARRAISWGRNARASDAARGRRERSAAAGKEPGVDWADRESREAVASALGAIPGEDAAVLTLRFLHGMDSRELAAVLDVSESGARVRVHRALAALREAAGARDADEERMGRAVAAAPVASLGGAGRATVVDGVLAAVRVAPAGAPAGGVAASGASAGAWRGLVAAAVVVTAAGAWVVARGRGEGGAGAPPAAAGGGGAESAAGPTAPPPRLAAAPAGSRTAGEPPAAERAVRFGMALMGTGERVGIRQVMIGGDIHDFDPAVVEPRVRVKPGARVGLHTQDARVAVWTVNARVPDPAPEEVVVSVPLRDDPRVRAPVFRVVDRKTGAPLPRGMLEPGPGAVALQPLPADEQGRIRVPAGVAEQFAAAWRNVGASFAEPDHEPRGYGGLFERGASDAEQIAAWDAAGERTIELDAISGPVPRMRLRIVDAGGAAVAGALLEVRLVGIIPLLFPAYPTRTDAKGRAEIVAPPVFALDVYDGAGVAGTFVLARAATAEGKEREVRLRERRKVHLEIEGGPAEAEVPLRVSSYFEMESLDPDALTGYAWKKGVRAAGWKAFSPAEPDTLAPVSGETRVFEVPVLAGRTTVVWVSAEGKGRELRVAGDGPRFVRSRWDDLAPVSPFEPPYDGYTTTDEPLSPGPPAPVPSKPAGK